MKSKETEKLSQRSLRRHDNELQCGILDWILKQKKDLNGKTGEIQIKSIVVFNRNVPVLIS